MQSFTNRIWKLAGAMPVFLLSCIFSFAQDCPKTENKKAIKFFLDATAAFKARDYDKALSNVARAIDEEPEFADAYLLQGTINLKRKNDKEFESNYKKVIELCPELEPDVYYELGSLYFYLKKWKDAEDMFKKFLEFDRINEDHGVKAEKMLVKTRLYAKPVPFNPVIVRHISTADPEYLPYISPDNELAFFTRRYEMKEKGMLTSQSVEKFMIAKLQSDGTYDPGKPMETPFNRSSSNNEGGAAITIDNKQLFFTVNNKGNFDIYTSEFVEGRWTDLRNLGPNVNDSIQWDSQPTISSDGKTLYFASAKDSLTGIDIYKTVRNDAGEWSKAVKLSNKINTNGKDKSPFIHSDSRTLYFSSDSLPGLGGFDIFRCQMDAEGNWGQPVNLGYPINTDADEVGFFVSTDGRTGYYASNKLVAGSNSYDIYSFDLYDEVRPDKVYFQKGDLNGPQNSEPIDAVVEVKDAVTNKLIKINVDSVSGEYAFVVNFENDLLVSVKKKGYAFESQYISSQDTGNFKPQKVDIQLKKLEVGGQYTLHDILFATNSYEINDTIKTVLNEFSQYMKDNPRLQVYLQGHTDNVGRPQENMTLSENRARAVSEYLISKGIAGSRLSPEGFGETKPIADNDTEAGRAKNRRTVFVVKSN